MIDQMQNVTIVTPPTRERRLQQINLHYHHGRYIRIPPDFVLPTKCSVKDVFVRYHVEDSVNEIPPLK